MASHVHWLGGNWAPFIWAVALTLVMHIVLTRTRWGLHTVSVGGNMLGAREAGIHVNTIKYGNFMLTGLFGALVGLQNAYVTSSIDPTAGGYQPMFYAIDGGGHRRHRDARRHRDGHRRVPRRDRHRHAAPTAS